MSNHVTFDVERFYQALSLNTFLKHKYSNAIENILFVTLDTYFS